MNIHGHGNALRAFNSSLISRRKLCGEVVKKATEPELRTAKHDGEKTRTARSRVYCKIWYFTTAEWGFGDEVLFEMFLVSVSQ